MTSRGVEISRGGNNEEMITVTLGAVLGSGLLLALIADWFSHPDIEVRPVEIESVDDPRRHGRA